MTRGARVLALFEVVSGFLRTPRGSPAAVLLAGPGRSGGQGLPSGGLGGTGPHFLILQNGFSSVFSKTHPLGGRTVPFLLSRIFIPVSGLRDTNSLSGPFTVLRPPLGSMESVVFCPFLH